MSRLGTKSTIFAAAARPGIDNGTQFHFAIGKGLTGNPSGKGYELVDFFPFQLINLNCFLFIYGQARGYLFCYCF